MGNGLPETLVTCGGCDKELNVLKPHLCVQIKAQRSVLLIDHMVGDDAAEDDEAPGVSLGTRSGRGRIALFHDFSCIEKYGKKRKELSAKIEHHHEEEVYVPDDNRSTEELVEAGELPEAMLAVFAAAERGEG
jgi:hypothetical protein